MGRVHSVELLRFAAAGLVLFAHLKFPVLDVCGADALPPALAPLGGAAGVDLFFVISGFVIALSVDRPDATWRTFLAARLARVVPAYTLFTAAALLTTHLRYVPVAPDTLANSFLYLPVLDVGRFAGTFHPYGWTLSFEMWFYLLAAGVLAAGGRRAVAPALVALFAVGPLALLAAGYDGAWYFPRFALSPMTAEFALGCLAYRLTRRPLPGWVGVAGVLAGAVGLAVGTDQPERLALMEPILNDPSRAAERVLAWGVPAFLLVAGSVAVERRGGAFPAPRLAAAVGGLSYPLYLVQPFAFLAVRGVCEWAGCRSPWAVAAAAAAGAVGSAVLVRRTVDAPLSAWAKGWLTRLLTPAPARVAANPFPLPATPAPPTPSPVAWSGGYGSARGCPATTGGASGRTA